MWCRIMCVSYYCIMENMGNGRNAEHLRKSESLTLNLTKCATAVSYNPTHNNVISNCSYICYDILSYYTFTDILRRNWRNETHQVCVSFNVKRFFKPWSLYQVMLHSPVFFVLQRIYYKRLSQREYFPQSITTNSIIY